MSKIDLAAVHKTAEEILEKIIVPICNVPVGIAANIFTAKLPDYDSADPEKRQKILSDLIQKYDVDRNGLEAIQEYPLALLALYILDKRSEAESKE